VIKYLIPFLISVLFSFLLTPLIRLLAVKIGAVDLPGERKVHQKPMPSAGGLVIFVSSSLCILTMLSSGFASEYFRFLSSGKWTGALIGAVIIVGLGLFDDIRRLHYAPKAIIQLLAGLILVAVGFEIKVLSLPFSSQVLELGYFSIPFTILWIMGITNALNLIDGLDGLAAGVALIACGTIFSVAVLNGNAQAALLCALLGGTILGFLRYNFHPASIFLGDSGSLFLGYCLSLISIEGAYKGAAVLSIMVPLLALGLPIIDTLLAMFRRFFKGLRLVSSTNSHYLLLGMFKADRDHIHHRLLRLGLSQQRVVLMMYGLGVLLGLGAISTLFLKNRDIGFLMLAVGIATYGGIKKLGYNELEVVKGSALLPVFSLPMVNRRIFHVFFDVMFISLAYAGALIFKYEAASYAFLKSFAFKTFPLILLIKVAIFYFGGVYRRSWRHTNVADGIMLFQIILLSSFLSYILSNLILPVSLSFRIFVIDCFLLTLLAGGSRLSFRVLDYFHREEKKTGERAIIYGAGRGGAFALREFLSNTSLHLLPIGFIDDDQKMAEK
jgi:UDP-GlcNAc:undecaprenyl-phosphate GlcNAc-1-phosphate transferase